MSILRSISLPLFASLWFGSSGVLANDTLAGIYELALQNDPVLKAAEASFKAGSEAGNLGRAALLPQVSASYNYRDNDTDTESQSFIPIDPNDISQGFTVSPATSSEETDTDTLTIDLQQNLFNLPAWFSFKQSKKLSRVAEAQFAFDQQELIVRVAEAYFNVLRAKDNLETTIAEEKALQRQLEQTEQRFEVGLIAITDVHESRAAYDLARVTRLEAEGQLGVAYEALSVLTGQSHSNLWLLSSEFPVQEPDPASRAEWVDFALANNYQLKAAQLSEQAALENSRAKRAEHLPKLTGSYTYQDAETDGLVRGDTLISDPSRDSESNTVAINLSVPLFAGGGISAARRQAAQEHIQSRENHIATQRNTIQSTRSLHLSVLTDVGKVNARRQSITSAESALEATQAGYEVGTRNVVDVLDSQRFLFRALRDYANARYDYVINSMRLKQQAGILSPQDIYELNKWLEQPPAPTASLTPG